MSTTSPPPHHSIYLSGNFEIEKRVTPITDSHPEHITYSVSIGCAGADREARFMYEIMATGFVDREHKLFQDNTYFLRGSFFPCNRPETEGDRLVFEGAEAAMIASIDNYEGDYIDSVGISGLGIVIGLDHIVEKCCQYLCKSGKDDDVRTTVVTMQHSELNPMTGERHMSKVEYLVRPTPNLARIATFLKLGRECVIHGFVKDFNVETCCYIAVANKVYMTSAFQEMPSASKGRASASQGVSKKPTKFNSRPVESQFVSPVTASTSSRAIQVESGRDSDFTTPLASTSSPALSLPSTASSVPTVAEVQPPKKKARAPPKGKGKKRAQPDEE